MDLNEFRTSLDAWLDEHEAELTPSFDGVGTLDEQMAQLAKVKSAAYEAGWMRWGWPERVGGLGGSPLFRGYLGEALTLRDLVEPGAYSMTEVLAPTMIDFARPELAAEMVPLLLRGDELWCQGFSEPGTGSNLASLQCRAVRADDGWHVTGQKVWTSFANHAARCVLLTRTGAPDSAHRGITALFVDMDSPGITVRPLGTMHGGAEFCEVFFDDVSVPFERMLGEEGQGWSVAMDLLPYERSTSLWHRGAFLRRRLEQLIATAPPDALSASEVGDVFLQLFALRGRSRATQHRLAAGERLGPETSIDKILMATAEQAVFDLVAAGLASQVVLGDDPSSEQWRSQFMYSRAATIYGGSAEIQRNIVARRLLDLGADAVMDSDELELFRSSVQQATASHTGKALDDALEELGWRDALAGDRRAAVSTLFEMQGRANATSSALDIVMADALGVDAAVVLPPLGRWAPPGQAAKVHGVGTAALEGGDRAVVAFEDAVLVVETTDLTLRRVGGVDPSIELVEVTGDRVQSATQVEPAWTTAVAAGQLALAHELVGVSRAALELARQHAIERVQFGRPIASFQAVRHRLAESLVAIEAAHAALDAAWRMDSPLTATAAKAVAGRGARTVAKHCQQVLAGIGYTTELPFHRYFRRILVLDGLLGDARALTKQLGEELLRTRQLPPVLPL